MKSWAVSGTEAFCLPCIAGAVVLLSLLACQGADEPFSPEHDPSKIDGAARPLAPGQVEPVLALTPGIDMPEGIAVDRQGNLFVGNRRLEGDVRVSEILEITPGGAMSVRATLDPAAPPFIDFGVLGLAVGPGGDLYAALASTNPATHGVWRIRKGGAAKRLPGSQRMQIPDALAFDVRGNLYVTDVREGTVWRFGRDGSGRRWIRHELLSPNPDFGANGIAFVPPRSLFVANTERALIARIPIEPDGSAGTPEVVAAGFELFLIDGLAADAHGDLHAVIVGSVFFGTAPLVRVDPETGAITPSTTEVGELDDPTSLAFGAGRLDRKSVYVINADLFSDDQPGTGPGVVRVGVGVPGAPTR